jgi:hypothetical protein
MTVREANPAQVCADCGRAIRGTPLAALLVAMSPFDLKLPVRPDEWGVYDPDKAGLAAVLERLAKRGSRRQEGADTRGSALDAQPRLSADGR